MLGEPACSTSSTSRPHGVSDNQLRDNIKAALGPATWCRRARSCRRSPARRIRGLLKYFNYFLLGFGAIALLVGVFLILNTFSIIVSQRTQELALLRAMGASRDRSSGRC